MSQNISPAAKAAMFSLHKNTALAYGGTAGQQFSATPSVAQTLNNKIIEDGNWFLQMLNTLPVSEIKGDKVYMGLSGNVSGRTDTSGEAERVAKHLVDLNGDGYELFKTDSDIGLKYNMIDAWAKFNDFRARYGLAVRQAIGNDRLKVGWVGTSAAATTVET
jgi:hypothetical protein